MKNTIQSNARTTSANTRGRRLRHTMGSLGALLLLGTSAAAQVTPTGPFTGQYQEDFEANMSLALGYAPNPVFQGSADYFTSQAVQASSWGYGCTINPHGGTKFVGDVGGLMWFDFAVAPTKFGGYFGTNQPNGSAIVTVRFLDSMNAVVATDTMLLQNNCLWKWSGWSFSLTNIYRIEFESTAWIEHVMMDDLELNFSGSNSCTSTFCFGDGSVANCPCGNNSISGGCANSTGNGATLAATGSCSVANNDAGLITENLLPNSWALFFEGGSLLPGGATPFVDGLLCVGGPYLGLQFTIANSAGVAAPTVSLVSPPGLGSGNHWPGDTTYYQCFYYTPGSSSVCGTNWNLTNGVKRLWTP